MTARLLIEASSYDDIEDWIFRLDENDIVRGDSFDLAIRSAGEPKKPRFTFTLSSDSASELSDVVSFFRELGLARAANGSGDAFEFSAPHDVTWDGILPMFVRLFADELDRALLRNGKPFFTRKFVTERLEALAQQPDAGNKLRAAIYATLVRIEKLPVAA